MINKITRKTLLAVTMAVSTSSMALETISTLPGEPVEVSVSQNEFTMFKVEGSKIVRLDGESFIDNSAKDKGTGNAFIKPATSKKFTVFIKDSNGRTWPVRIIPDAKKMGDVVVINDASPVKTVVSVDSPVMKKSVSRIDSIKSMMKAMVADLSPNDMTVKKMSVPIDWWAESDVVKTNEYFYKNLKGSVYTLRNISLSKMVIDEQEFYSNGVVSVAIDDLHLEPNELTRVFVIADMKE